MHISRHPNGRALLLALGWLAWCSASGQAADSQPEASPAELPANHKQESEHQPQPARPGSRQARQYDAPVSSASASQGYAAVAADGGAYAAQMAPGQQLPYELAGAGPASGQAQAAAAAAAAAAAMAGYHEQMARGYTPAGSHLSPAHHAPSGPFGPAGGMFMPPGPLPGPPMPGMGGSLFPLSGPKAFDVSEIVCTAIAVAIGAVIVGAPFILIYLFIMNQMNGGSGAGALAGPNGGSISLTGPTSSTTVSGRKKRQASLPEVLFKQLSPLVNSEQVANTFKLLLNSLAKYQA